MSALVIQIPEVRNFVSARDMKPGQIGRFQYGLDNVIALRTFDNIVDLNHPSQTWRLDCSHQIELLPEGSLIHLRAEIFDEK